MNTADFEDFKLHSDNTLKAMKKDDLIDYIHMLHNNWKVCDESYYNVMEYARLQHERFSKILENPPLKFEELQEGMWVWDDSEYEKNYALIKRTVIIGGDCCVAMKQDEGDEGYIGRIFEENRFYRREVTDES